MTLPPDPALDRLKARVAGVPLGAKAEELGTVLTIGDGLATVSGLPGARLNEILEFPGGTLGFVLSLEEQVLHAAFLDPVIGVGAGDLGGQATL